WLGKKTELTGALVVAMFQHDTSRAQDPQLHTHALVLNATQREDGKWRSLHSRPLFEHKMAAGNVYRAALALSLQRMGFEIEQTHADGRFEISGVPTHILDTFSKRRADIDAKLAKWNQEGALMSAKAALKTRERKRPSSLLERRESWAAEAAALGFDPALALREGMSGLDRTERVSDSEKLEILRDAIDRLSEREAAFTNADLVGATLAAGMGKLNVEDAMAIARNAARTKQVDLYAARIGERKAWTTPQAAQHEQRIEDLVVRGRDSAAAVVGARAVDKLLRDSKLNQGQREAVKLIVSSKDQFVAVVGRPGTGKTTMVGSVKQILDREGYTAIGMAPNGAAAKELADGGRLGVARTVSSHVARVGRQVSQLKKMGPAPRDALMEEFRRQVWIVDESSQLPNAEMRKLLQLAAFTGAKVALIGDPAQLEAINAGRPFDRLVKSGIRQVEMTQIHRQRDQVDRTLVQTAIDRDIAKAMTLLDPKIRELGADREAELVRQWWGSENRSETLMISMRNEVKTRLNDRARGYLRDAGELGGEVAAKQLFPVFGQRADRQHAASYKPGDILRFGVDHKKMEIGADSYWHVLQVEGKTSVNRLTISDGQKVLSFNSREAKGALRHAEHFRPRTTTLAVNDRIVWNRPDREKGLVNGDVLSVYEVSDRGVRARTSDGRLIDFDPAPGGRSGNTAQDQHWEHYYATSLYKSQGKTADRVLVDAPVQDAHMVNHHAFLVGVSRHRESVVFFTDDKRELARRILHNPGDKTSALESLADERTDRLRSTMELISRAFGSSSRPSEPSPVASIMDGIKHSSQVARDRDQLPPRVAALLNPASAPVLELDSPTRDPERSIGL
ncbi:MAG TPA: MobF family relaxase, partial [Vicinamibacterales bacterium]|nr:MobF family relaxase [Vicinamibacterales bacterium]